MAAERVLRVGMVGAGMIFEETYRPALERLRRDHLFDPLTGPIEVRLVGIASRTGRRAAAYRQQGALGDFAVLAGPDSVAQLLQRDVDVVCVATPDDRHYLPARQVLEAGRHLLVEKPAVLSLTELDQLGALAEARGVLAKVVYHKLLDPDHMRLRTLVVQGALRHCNSGYCTLLEPRMISANQFAEWITGRNPGSYVAVHYLKLIDFTFFDGQGALTAVQATGQRGLVGPATGSTWDSVQLRLHYRHDDGREAAFDLHTSWVHPDNFPGYVDQEVQFRFDNGVWNAQQRRRGVEATIEGATPLAFKNHLNNHYSAPLWDPWQDPRAAPWGQAAGSAAPRNRGYGVAVIERFFHEVAQVEFASPDGAAARTDRLWRARALRYNELSADRRVVAAVQGMEHLLARHADHQPHGVVWVNHPQGGLVHQAPGGGVSQVLYCGRV